MLNMFQSQRFTGLVSFAARKTTYRMGTSIPVILLDTVNNLGEKGYARNLLIPKKLAIYATEANRGLFQIPTPKRNKQ